MKRRASSSLLSVVAMVLAGLLAGCSSVDLSKPEVPLQANFRDGAEIHVASFSGIALATPVEGPSISLLQDQITFGMIRCSRPGPRLNLRIDTEFATRKEPSSNPHQIIGVAEWVDPATGQVVGLSHIDVDLNTNGWGDSYVQVNTRFGTYESSMGVPRAQVVAGEAFASQICEKGFGWRGAED